MSKEELIREQTRSINLELDPNELQRWSDGRIEIFRATLQKQLDLIDADLQRRKQSEQKLEPEEK